MANPENENTETRAPQRVGSNLVIEKTEHLPVHIRNNIRWLHAHYWDNNLGLQAVGKLIGYEGTTISRVFNGKYEGDLEQIANAIDKFRVLVEERATVNRPPYQETALYREIESLCNAARAYQKIGFAYGESQIGKTEAFKHYASREKYNHGMTVHVEMPVGGSLSQFIPAICDALRIPGKHRTGEAFGAITSKLNENMLLIIDEAARAEPGTRAEYTLDFIRAIYDARRPGVMLVGTNIFRDQMANEKFEPFLRQLHRRVLFRRQLPDRPSRADLNLFAKYYHLGPAEGDALELQRRVIAEHGLGVWLTTLTAANRKAKKEGKTMTWEHIVKAHSFFVSLSTESSGEN